MDNTLINLHFLLTTLIYIYIYLINVIISFSIKQYIKKESQVVTKQVNITNKIV
jgi:hypothetical protein